VALRNPRGSCQQLIDRCCFRCDPLPRTEVEMDTKHEDLTAAEHAERAESQGQTVAEYCQLAGLSPHALGACYGGRQLQVSV
jgi:hypothetical protein